MSQTETGLERPHVFLPAEESAAGPPLLLLHGTGGNEHDLLPLRERLSPGAAVLSVRGTVLENGMPRFFRRLQEGVFDEDDLRVRADGLGDFVTSASTAYGIGAGSLVAVGFSNGANIASALLLRRPGLLRAAVLLSAMIPFAEPPDADLTGTSVIISNGARDPMIPAAMTTQLVAQLRERGADVVEVHHGGGHQIDPAALAEISRLIAPTDPSAEGDLMTDTSPDLSEIEATRARIRDQHLRPAAERPASSARGLHHTALISGDVERTVRFYQDLLGFPLTELIDNRDYPGSSHFFFDIGNSNLLAFFDFPGLDVAPYAEVLGGLHHLATSVEPSRWQEIVDRFEAAGVDHVIHSGVSVYFSDPDGARIELIADPLGEMYGEKVLG